MAKIDNQSKTDIYFSEEKSDIYTALQYLRKEEQVAILLALMEDKIQKEIARIMGLPLGTVKTHILKGKERLNLFLTSHIFSCILRKSINH